MNKDEIKHINWMYNRLTSVHKENPNVDYMIRFKEIIDKQLTLCDVVSSFITAEDEGNYFVVNTDDLDEIEKGSTVYLLETYPEDIHLFKDKNDDEFWISADDVDRKE